MKNLFLLVILSSFVLFGTLSAQVVETEMPMSDGIQSALEVDLMTDSKQSEKVWKKYVKKIGKLDWDRKNKEHVLFNVIITDIDREYPVTVFTKFSSAKDITKGTFWFKMDSDYLNSNDDAEKLRGAGKWIQAYAYDVEKQYISDQLKGEEKTLEGFENDLRKLTKKNENLHKDIKKAKDQIAKAEREIEDNIKDQKDKNKEIETQKNQVVIVKKSLDKVGKKSLDKNIKKNK